ncbi:FAD-dependent oxidoreductase [Desulfoluna sp.]|uniref:oxidoreductase n=1 Tax=Desulfoluna sp. TaxID=2045199 RepID=UPI002636F2A9|nr:FAD-dependent oxidoreductase [Desulfoluna sp.]
MFETLFSPITIHHLTLKNRIAYPSLGLLYSWDRKLNDRYLHYFTEIARGGAGIVTVGPVGVDFLGSGLAVLGLDHDKPIADFKRVTDAIRAEGASPWIQLFHAGAYSHPILINGETPLGPSAVYSKYTKATPKEMTSEEIRTVQSAFADAAGRAVEAGFDGVEIIGSAGYLLTQFLSPKTNKRTDEYGGSFENRLRFPTEVIAACRKTVGKAFPLSIRMAGNDFVPEGNTDEITPLIARAYEKSGVNLINVTGGWHESKVPQLPMDLPRAGYAYLAAAIRKAVTVPVMASNRISTPMDAERLLNDGYCDMVNLGRVLIADPFWPAKAKAGRVDEIRPCVACSQGCTDEIFSGNPVSCIGNPRAGYEAERIIKPTASPQKIMVAGAGPAGLEAAVTAAQMGHAVHLFETRDAIGGQIELAAAPPHKEELLEYIRYYRAMLTRHGVTVSLSTPVTLDLIRAEQPDHIFVAEGAAPAVPPIDGADIEGILSSWDVLKKDRPLGHRVALIGGGAVGLETALHIAVKGTLSPEMFHFLSIHDTEPPEKLRERLFSGNHEVTVFEMAPRAGGDLGRSTRWVMMNHIKRYGVHLVTGARVTGLSAKKVTGLSSKKVTWHDGNEKWSQEFDTIILATGSQSVTALSDRLPELGIPFTRIGDGLTPGKFNHAIHGGFLAALQLDAPGAP